MIGWVVPGCEVTGLEAPGLEVPGPCALSPDAVPAAAESASSPKTDDHAAARPGILMKLLRSPKKYDERRGGVVPLARYVR